MEEHIGLASFVGSMAIWFLYCRLRKESNRSRYATQQAAAEAVIAKATKQPQGRAITDDFVPSSMGQREYDIIIVGAGLSGLKAAHSLTTEFGIDKSRILILEAQDYVGGRVKQSLDFIPGCKIDLGAEFIHGDNSMVNEFADETNQPLQNLFCWAHGDGGPSEAPIDDDGVLGYGLYYFAGGNGKASRLLRFDDSSPEFKEMNRILWDLSHYDLEHFDESKSMYDYLKDLNVSDEMIGLAKAGFANTMASNLEELSLKQNVHWSKEEHYDKTHSTSSRLSSLMMHQNEATEEGKKKRSGSLAEIVGHRDYRFKRSYSCLVDHLKEGLNIVTNCPIALVDYSQTFMGGGRVALQTNNGDVYRAQRAIITCPPPVLKNRKLIDFLPPLPADKQDAMQCVAMYTATKIILTFSERVWPAGLHGIIMAGTLVPEVWFKEDNPKNHVVKGSQDDIAQTYKDARTIYIAVGFLSARYAEQAAGIGRKMLIQTFLEQLDKVFSHMKPEHLAADPIRAPRNATPLVPSSRFLRGLVYDWAENHPYVGGAYSSPLAGKPIDYPDILARPINDQLFFAGEATNTDAGACTHSALETGHRVAKEVSASFKYTCSSPVSSPVNHASRF